MFPVGSSEGLPAKSTPMKFHDHRSFHHWKYVRDLTHPPPFCGSPSSPHPHPRHPFFLTLRLFVVEVTPSRGQHRDAESNFYPLSDGPSTRHRRITKADFRPCSTGGSCSQAPFCLCTRGPISVWPEETFARLRYLWGGLRPRLLWKESRRH
ncbi:hypothetical protein Fmac_020425 [Flemingia macrophylla]|uniref:Uncharacterized protein n=1 Tax=Flemingia macrophylla TaxID=520843 RepID=A0ABD1LTZ7_9FABA